MYDINCKNLNANGSSGDIYINNLVAEESIKIKNSTGNVKIDNSDATGINIETTTGNVKGRLYTDKIFLPKTSTGKVEVPKTTSGGICEIKTSTGNIKMEIIQKER